MSDSSVEAGAPWLAVRDEVSAVLSALSSSQMQRAAELLGQRRRWFCAGAGRSGLIAQMVAMRLMHLGLDVHAVGEATAPAIGRDDALILVSRTGTTPTTLHQARLAQSFGAHLLVVTATADSPLAGLAGTVLEVPEVLTAQFGGTLFEQSALLLLDALVLSLTGGEAAVNTEMQGRHANLQ